MAKIVDKCSFCGRGRDEVNLLISGSTGNICAECAQNVPLKWCAKLMTRKTEKAQKMLCSLNKEDLPKPKDTEAFSWTNMSLGRMRLKNTCRFRFTITIRDFCRRTAAMKWK